MSDLEEIYRVPISKSRICLLPTLHIEDQNKVRKTSIMMMMNNVASQQVPHLAPTQPPVQAPLRMSTRIKVMVIFCFLRHI